MCVLSIMKVLSYLSLCFLLCLDVDQALQIDPVCTSSIYCNGELLHVTQMSKIFPDSKSFVNLKLLTSEEEILKSFNTLMAKTDNSPDNIQLTNFVENYFEDKDELDVWQPLDYDPNPPMLERIKNPNLWHLAKHIISIWPKLGRKVDMDVLRKPTLYSAIYVPKGFIVPEGKTKEFRYWDSYWIIRGLLISNMVITAKGMIENLLYLVTKFGYIPTGTRIYYLGRSHPPFLTLMVFDYFYKTGDVSWLTRNINTVEVELRYWLQKNITVTAKESNYSLLRYSSDINSKGPRPEFYNEDYNIAQKIHEPSREPFYTQLKSATESGWELSSRWIVSSEMKTQFNMTDIKTSQIVPVDLNSIFAAALEKFGDLREILGYSADAKMWWNLAEKWRDAIDKVLWDDVDGTWYDYDSKSGLHIKKFYISCAAPLWAEAVESGRAAERARYFVKYLQTTGALKFPGGVPTSLLQTGEQFDYPYTWAPLQAMLISALEKSYYNEAKRLAKQLILTWIRVVYIGYNKWDKLFDKYNCQNSSEDGGGPEYGMQYGYGWTNGYTLHLLQKYGDKLLVNIDLN